MPDLSVTEYAYKMGLTRQAILAQIEEKRLPKNVSAKKVGATWVLKIKESKDTTISNETTE